MGKNLVTQRITEQCFPVSAPVGKGRTTAVFSLSFSCLRTGQESRDGHWGRGEGMRDTYSQHLESLSLLSLGLGPRHGSSSGEVDPNSLIWPCDISSILL